MGRVLAVFSCHADSVAMVGLGRIVSVGLQTERVGLKGQRSQRWDTLCLWGWGSVKQEI